MQIMVKSTRSQKSECKVTVKAPPLFVSVTVPCGRVVDTPMISPSAYPFAAIYHITVKLLHVQDTASGAPYGYIISSDEKKQ